MTNATLFLGVVLGAAMGVLCWLAALKLAKPPASVESAEAGSLRRVIELDRLKLLALSVLAVIIVGAAVLMAQLNTRIEELHDLNGCVVAIHRTPPGPSAVTDEQLRARGCPTPPPFDS